MVTSHQQAAGERIKAQYQTPKNLEARIALHANYGTSAQPWTAWLLAQMTLPSGAQILELGCGSAYFWRENLGKVSPSWKVVLTDLSKGMLESAKNVLASHDSGPFEFAEMNAEEITFSDASFDAVLANHMLYHVADRGRALREIRRVLRSDGVLFAATNGERNMQEFREPELFNILHPNGPPAGALFQSEGAKDWFTLERGERELRDHFSEVRVEFYPGEMRVDDVNALLAYHGSYITLTEEQRTALTHYYEERKGPDGCFFITKSVGVLIASH